MVGRENRQLGHASRSGEYNRSGERLSGLRDRTQKLRMGDLVRQIDLQPIGRIMQADIGIALWCAPILYLGAEFRLRLRDPLRPVDLREAAREHRLGFVIEGANEVRLPPVPHARTDRLDVGGGKNGEEL